MTTEEKQPEQTPAWFIDEGIPGAGDRPAWLPEKFKSVSDMAKAHSELEKRFGQAPDEYDFSKSKHLDPDYAPFEDVKKLAKEKRVPQEVFDSMLTAIDKFMDEFSTDTAEEIKSLGEDGQARIKTLDNWAQANLSKDAYEALTGNIRTAGQIKALEELRGKMMSDQPQVPGNSGGVANAASVADIQQEISQNLAKFKSDDGYRKDVQKRLEVAVKNTPGYVDKLGS